MKRLRKVLKPIMITFISVFCLYASLTHAQQNLQFQADPKLSVSQVQEKRELIGALNQMIAPTMLIPKNLLIRLNQQGDDAYHESFLPKGHRITVPYQFNLFKNVKHPSFTNPIIAHEYGHCILSENLGLNDNFRNQFARKYRFIDFYKWEALNAQVEELQVELERIQQMLKEKIQAGAKETDPEVVALIAKGNEIAELKNKLIDEMQPLLDNYGKVFEMLGKYHEFFADIVALTYFNYNPTVVWKAVYTTKIRSANQPTSTEKKILRSLELRRFDKKFELDDVSFGDSHIELSPVRYYIYKYYLSNPLYNKNKAMVIKVVFEAVKDEMLSLGQSDSSSLSLAELNKRFMARLDQYFAKIKVANR